MQGVDSPDGLGPPVTGTGTPDGFAPEGLDPGIVIVGEDSPAGFEPPLGLGPAVTVTGGRTPVSCWALV